MNQSSLEQKIEALASRITLLENENSELKLQVKDLKQDIDILKNTKTSTQSTHLTKNNHMSSTNSITDKAPRISEKLHNTSTTLQRVDSKKKELIKPMKNVLTQNNALQNSSVGHGIKPIQTKTINKPTKINQNKVSTPTNKSGPRKSIPNVSSSTTLQRSVSQNKKGFQFYSFMPCIKQQMQKVISIQKLELSYQNSPNKQKIDSQRIIIQEAYDNFDMSVFDKSFQNPNNLLKRNTKI